MEAHRSTHRTWRRGFVVDASKPGSAAAALESPEPSWSSASFTWLKLGSRLQSGFQIRLVVKRASANSSASVSRTDPCHGRHRAALRTRDSERCKRSLCFSPNDHRDATRRERHPGITFASRAHGRATACIRDPCAPNPVGGTRVSTAGSKHGLPRANPTPPGRPRAPRAPNHRDESEGGRALPRNARYTKKRRALGRGLDRGQANRCAKEDSRD